MSKWDWIHAGLEAGTFLNTLSAQRTLGEMQTAQDIEKARALLLKAMKDFVFDISQDIQLAEEQIASSPQQVYILAQLMDWRLNGSGLSTEIFSDFEEKEYFFKTQRKIAEVIGNAKQKLTAQQIEQADLAVKYVAETQLLQDAVPAKAAQEELMATESRWNKISSAQASKKTSKIIGFVAFATFACIACPVTAMVITSNLAVIADPALFGAEGKATSATLFSILSVLVTLAILVGSIYFIVKGSKSNPEFNQLKARRDALKQQLMPHDEWQQVVADFGDIPSEQLQKLLDERNAFLTPILGSERP